MRKTAAFLFFIFCMTVMLFAQEEGGGPEIDPDWDFYDMDFYRAGDQTFTISLGTVFPTVFIHDGKVINHNFTPPVGGAGSIAYNYYLTPNVFIGGELSGMFLHTLGRHTAYFIPLGLRAGYQFNVWRLEFPLTLTVGMVWQNYLNLAYYGFYMKGGGAAFYRFNSEWSFGLTTNWCWFPQWTNEPHKNVDGNIVELTLSARYHF
jgi:hypothetical protein